MRDVAIIGVGMTKFGKFLNKGLKDLGREALWLTLKDAGIKPQQLQFAYAANGLAGLITGQEGIRGQVILRDAGLGGIPIVNVENACASASTAFREAYMMIAGGFYDIGLAIGVEKLYCEDVSKSVRALAADSDIEISARFGLQFTAFYALALRKFMAQRALTKHHLAKVVVKNSYNGSLNPLAQYRRALTEEEVLSSRLIADPLTLYMCAPMGDGAAAAILCSADLALKLTDKPLVKVAASAMRSGQFHPPQEEHPSVVTLAAKEAYEKAGVGPEDINVTEVHDAMAPAELMIYEELGYGKGEEVGRMIEEGVTAISGKKPVNPSGGLASKGHPVGATGLAMISEIVWQLRGEAGARQVKNPRIGLIENAGGMVEGEAAACCVTILKK